MQSISVELGPRSYEIIIGESLYSRFCDALADHYGDRTCIIVTNTTLARLYPQQLAYWEKRLDAVRVTLPDGERYKTIETWRTVIDALATHSIDRDGIVIAFGGGVIGDIAGFAAAAYARGINYVQAPTTLLSMVDSAVGGKTGVNHEKGKNLVGAFYQPGFVWIDTTMLDTLAQREYVAGYGEVFKYAFIGGEEMATFIADNGTKILQRERGALQEAIARSLRIKAMIVGQDETERTGMRCMLNFGHTFAHALERYCRYETMLHGEAVLWGIACAAYCAKSLRMIEQSHYETFMRLFHHFPDIVVPVINEPHRLYDYMFTDKKTQHGTLRFVLPTAPGHARLVAGVDKEAILDSITFFSRGTIAAARDVFADAV
jgi:3-dehydroquinate synthase